MLLAVPLRKHDTQLQSTGWQSERILCDGDQYFSAVFRAIRAAVKSIDVESYIFEDDTLGRQMIEELLSAQSRGISVRVLIDGVGSANFIGGNLRDAQARGLDIRVHHPLPWQIIPHVVSDRNLTFRNVLRLFSYMNSRNHRKMVVVDSRMAFVGSLNVSEVHLREVLKENAWHDLGAQVEGESVQILERIFEKTWHRSWQRSPRGFLRPPILLRRFDAPMDAVDVVRNDSRLLRHKALSRRLSLIRQARRRVWIANAYFVPSGQLLRALMAAARRGVDVRILLPKISDVHFMPWVARAFYESLIRHGVQVYEYAPRVLHAKVMLVDDTAWVGSSNLNHRSLLHDYELDVVLSSKSALSQLESVLQADFLSSHRIVRPSQAGHTFFQKAVVGLLLYFKHLL